MKLIPKTIHRAGLLAGRVVKPSSRRKLTVGILIFAAAAGIAYWRVQPAAAPAPDAKPASDRSAAKISRGDNDIRLMVTGDWIAHDSVNMAARQSDGSYNYLPLVSDIQPVFNTADIRFCNDPILNGGESLGIHGYPKFNSPTEFVTDMGRFGCNLVNTASNHSFDYSQKNIDNSVSAWHAVPNMLAVAGENQSQAQHDQVHTFSVKGVKFAFLAYTTYINTDSPAQNNYGVNIFNENFAAGQIRQAKAAGAQFIITSIRWGTEYSTTANAQQAQIAKFLADQGVDLVLGHGTHELQPVQRLTGADGHTTTVWYGVGNFLNTQEPPETLFNGLPVIDISPKTRHITDMRFLPVYMHYEWTAAQAAADQTLTRHGLHMYLLEDANQAMINKQQLKTTITTQKARLGSTLSAYGLTIPLVTSRQLLAD